MCVQGVRSESGMWCSTRGSMVLAVSWTPPFLVTVCYVQFPQRFDGIDRSDQYPNHNIIFFDVKITPFLYHPQVPLKRMSLIKEISLINHHLQ
jgi:hypothetical protein